MKEIAQRILDLMKERNLNQHQLEVAAGLKNASIRGWVKGKKRDDGEYVPTNPSSDSIIKLATYFNVSADYLLCLSDEPTPLKRADIIERPDYALSTELAELAQDERFVNSAKLYKEMPDEYRQQICTYILGVAVGLGMNVENILRR